MLLKYRPNLENWFTMQGTKMAAKATYLENFVWKRRWRQKSGFYDMLIDWNELHKRLQMDEFS